MKQDVPLNVLIDNCTIGHGVISETVWISTGKQRWGDIEFDSGELVRIPVHTEESNSDLERNVRYLYQIARLARKRQIILWTSKELLMERFFQPLGRYMGYRKFDQPVFQGIEIKSVDGRINSSIRPKYSNTFEYSNEQVERLKLSKDELFLQLRAVLGETHLKDAWHIRTAEAHDMYCFLTMDFRLTRMLKTVEKKEPIASLRTKTLTPEEFGAVIGIAPEATKMHVYDDASFPVRQDLHLNGVRQPRPRKK